MIKTRGRKIIRDVLARKGRTILVALSIFIGVTGVITLFSLGDILVSQLREDLDEDKFAMLEVFITVKSGTELENEAYLQTLQDIPGVTAIQGHLEVPIAYKLNAEEDGFREGFVRAYSAPFDAIPLEPLRLVSGTYPIAGQQVAIESRMAERLNLGVGDSLIFRILDEDTLTTDADGNVVTPEETFEISAIVFQPYGSSNANPADSTVFANFEDAQRFGGATGYNAYMLRYEDYAMAQDNATAFSNAVVESTPYIPLFTLQEDPENNQLIAGVQTISAVLGILAMIALIVSGFLVVNVINSIVVEQKRQIGVMKTLGATSGDTFFMYSGIAFTYGLIGVIPGVIMGAILGYVASKQLENSVNTVIDGFRVSVFSIVIGAIVGLVVPVLASILPVLMGTRVKVLDAITDMGIDVNYGSGPIARFISLLPIPITIRQGLSNVSLKKGRLFLTVITLAIAAGAFMGVTAIFYSINSELGGFLDTFNIEAGVFPNEAREQAEVTAALEAFSAENDNIFTSIEPGSQLLIEVEGFKILPQGGGPPGILVYGFDTTSETPVFDVTVNEGEMLNESNYQDGIILSSTLAGKVGDPTIGDSIVLLGAGQRAAFKVVGISNFPIDQVWMDWRALAIFSGFTVDGEPVPQGYFLTTNLDEPTASDVDDVTSKMNEYLLARGIPTQTFNFIELIDLISSGLAIFQVIFTVVALLIALVGALGLLSTLSMSVFERQKEIGVMRSIGAGSSTVALQFLTEGIVVGIISWLVGLPISYLISAVLIEALDFGETFQITYSPLIAVVGLAGMIVITIVASLWPSLAAARKTVSDILRYQ